MKKKVLGLPDRLVASVCLCVCVCVCFKAVTQLQYTRSYSNANVGTRPSQRLLLRITLFRTIWVERDERGRVGDPDQLIEHISI